MTEIVVQKAEQNDNNQSRDVSGHMAMTSFNSCRPEASFDKNDGRAELHVLLLSYQKSGSSIISSLFGDDAGIFFLYEPLDSISSPSLYGLSPGWSVPTDFAINRNVTVR